MAKSPRRRPDQHRAVVLGIPGILLGLGPAMIPFNFWAGVAISTAAAALLLYLFRHLFGRDELRQRHAGYAITILGWGIIFWAIWIPNSIQPTLYVEDAKLKEGDELYGITWQKNYYYMSLLLWNMSSSDMTNVDIYVRTDLTIATIGVAPGINACSKDAIIPGISMSTGIAKPMDGGEGAIPILVKGKSSANVWRIRCERISNNSTLELVLPIINNLPATERKEPQWAKAWFSLKAGYRPTSFAHEECFIKPCRDIPRTIYGEVIPAFSPLSVVGYAAFSGDALPSGLLLGSLQ